MTFLSEVEAAITQIVNDYDLPTPSEPVVVIRLSTGWQVLWLPPGCSIGEFASITIDNDGGVLNIGSFVGVIDGVASIFSDSVLNGNSVFESVTQIGKSTGFKDFVGPRHGWLRFTSMGAYMNGVGPGVSGISTETVLRGQTFSMECNYNSVFPRDFAHLSDPDEQYGTLCINYSFSSAGLNVIIQRTITHADVASTASYGMGFPIMNVNRMMVDGVTTTIAKNLGIGSIDDPNLGPKTQFSFWDTAKPRARATLCLPSYGPSSPRGWLDAQNAQVFLQRRDSLSNYSNKLYVFGRSLDTATPISSAVINSIYQLVKV